MNVQNIDRKLKTETIDNINKYLNLIPDEKLIRKNKNMT